METIVIYMPGLHNWWTMNKKQLNRIPFMTEQMIREKKVLFIEEENKLHISSVTCGPVQFHRVTIDFKNEKVSFRKRCATAGDMHSWIFANLSSWRIDFLPKKMSYVMERPSQHTIKKE